MLFALAMKKKKKEKKRKEKIKDKRKKEKRKIYYLPCNHVVGALVRGIVSLALLWNAIHNIGDAGESKRREIKVRGR
jgi:hypothetical protein